MYKVFVGVTNKTVRIVPSSSLLQIHEREFGRLTREEALDNRDNFDEAIRGLLSSKGITDPENYSISLPDDLTDRNERRTPASELNTSDGKGPVVETNKEMDKEQEKKLEEVNKPLKDQKDTKDQKPKDE